MEKVNYDKIFQSTVEKFGGKKSLLLHCCCAPCAVSVLERLKDHFNVTLYFYNPNIDSEEEYFRRARELEKLRALYGIDEIIVPEYDPSEFIAAAEGYENLPEGGARCPLCFSLRLSKTASLADERGFDYFGTTLTVSPHKNSAVINEVGEKFGKSARSEFLYSDFKKREGYKRSGELSEKLSLYRQNYCGCAYAHNYELCR